MENGNKYILVVAFTLLQAIAFSQVSFRSTVSRDKILIGEPIILTVEAYMPLGSTVNWFAADSIPKFEITTVSPLDTSENIDGKKLSQTLLITSFDSGRIYIPSFEITVDKQPFYTDSIEINVAYTPFDPTADYRDIKNIIEISNPSVKYIPWVIAAIALLSLAGLLYFILRKRKLQAVIQDRVVPLLSPYEEAMIALRALGQRKIVNGDIKNYYSEMNDIFRKYLAREFGISTFERTNEELILQLSKLRMSKDAFFSLAQALRMSDFVKFAKYRPSETDNELNLGTMKNSIDLLNKTAAGAV